MNRDCLNKTIQRNWLVVAFGVVPLLVCWFGIRPDYRQIGSFKQTIFSLQSHETWQSGVTLASEQEYATLSAVQEKFLGRIKAVADRDELRRLCSSISDALAGRARTIGLRVLGIELQEDILKGRYIPRGTGAAQQLVQWPNVTLKGVQDPLSLPALELPSFDLALLVTGEYSQVFAFTEQFPTFPALISLAEVNTENVQSQVNYSLKIRAYYWTHPATSMSISLLKTGSHYGKQTAYEN